MFCLVSWCKNLCSNPGWVTLYMDTTISMDTSTTKYTCSISRRFRNGAVSWLPRFLSLSDQPDQQVDPFPPIIFDPIKKKPETMKELRSSRSQTKSFCSKIDETKMGEVFEMLAMSGKWSEKMIWEDWDRTRKERELRMECKEMTQRVGDSILAFCPAALGLILSVSKIFSRISWNYWDLSTAVHC